MVPIGLVKETTSDKKPYLPSLYSNSREVMRTVYGWDFMCFSSYNCAAVSQLTTFPLAPLEAVEVA